MTPDDSVRLQEDTERLQPGDLGITNPKECEYCHKVFSRVNNKNYHMKHRCKVKKQKEQEDREKDELLKQLLEENRLLKEKAQQPQTVINNITNNNTNNTQNINNTQNNINNTQNNNQFQMNRPLYLQLMHHVMKR